MAENTLTNKNNNGGNTIMNVIINFFAFIANFFRKEKTSTREERLNQEYNALYKENQKLEEIISRLTGWPGWLDPFTYYTVCELIKEIPKDATRYKSSEELHIYGEGSFYYYDRKHVFHLIPYSQISNEYHYLEGRGILRPECVKDPPKGSAVYDYYLCMNNVWKHLEMIQWHVEFRKERNTARMDEIMQELFTAPIGAYA